MTKWKQGLIELEINKGIALTDLISGCNPDTLHKDTIATAACVLTSILNNVKEYLDLQEETKDENH